MTPENEIIVTEEEANEVASYEVQLSWYERLMIAILKTGPIPSHTAFIMDGNRRFARENKLGHVLEGHKMGAGALLKVLQWCFWLGINEVTVYAFSIENFKRPKDEVQGLFNLVRKMIPRLHKLRAHKDSNDEVGIRVIGDINLFPDDLKHSLAEIKLHERQDYKYYLNIAIGYTSRAEIAHSMKDIEWGVKQKLIQTEDINESLLESCFWSASMKPVDMLVRTSGEIRLSDFLLWQTQFAPLIFEETLWPELSLWNLMNAVFVYQRNLEAVQLAKQNMEKYRYEYDKEAFYNSKQSLHMDFETFQEERNQRVKCFLQKLHEKRRSHWESLLLEKKPEPSSRTKTVVKVVDTNNNVVKVGNISRVGDQSFECQWKESSETVTRVIDLPKVRDEATIRKQISSLNDLESYVRRG